MAPMVAACVGDLPSGIAPWVRAKADSMHLQWLQCKCARTDYHTANRADGALSGHKFRHIHIRGDVDSHSGLYSVDNLKNLSDSQIKCLQCIGSPYRGDACNSGCARPTVDVPGLDYSDLEKLCPTDFGVQDSNLHAFAVAVPAPVVAAPSSFDVVCIVGTWKALPPTQWDIIRVRFPLPAAAPVLEDCMRKSSAVGALPPIGHWKTLPPCGWIAFQYRLAKIKSRRRLDEFEEPSGLAVASRGCRDDSMNEQDSSDDSIVFRSFEFRESVVHEILKQIHFLPRRY